MIYSRFLQFSVKTLAAVLLLISVFFRFTYSFSHVNFSQDQARDALYMEQLAEKGEWLVGYGPKASVGNFYLPPLYYQLQRFVAAGTGYAPLAMQWVVTIVEALTPVVIFAILLHVTRKEWAFFISLVYAAAVLPTTFGTFAWNPNMIPFLSTLALLAWIRLSVTTKSTWLYVGALATTTALHFHYQSAVLIPFAAIFCLTQAWKHPHLRKHLVYAILLSLATLGPYFWAEYYSNFTNLQAIQAYFAQEHSQYYDRVSKPEYVLTFIPSFVERVILGKNTPLIVLGRALVILGGITAVLAVRKNKKVLLLILYFTCIVLSLRFYKGDKIDYYLSTLFILPAILSGWISSVLPKQLAPLLMFLCVMTSLQLLRVPHFNGYADLRPVTDYLEQKLGNSQASVLFYQDDLSNVFAYSFHQSNIEIARGNQTLLEICTPSDACQKQYMLRCEESRAHTYANVLKSLSGYTFGSSRDFAGKYTITIGILENPVQATGYVLKPDDVYGSDQVLSGQYER